MSEKTDDGRTPEEQLLWDIFTGGSENDAGLPAVVWPEGRARPNEDEAVALGYGADGAVIAEAMLLEDGTTHITTVSLEGEL